MSLSYRAIFSVRLTPANPLADAILSRSIEEDEVAILDFQDGRVIVKDEKEIEAQAIEKIEEDKK